MKYKFCLLTVIFAFLLTSCSEATTGESESVNMDEVVFDGGNKKADGEIVFNDNFSGDKNENASVSMPTSQGVTKVAADQSRINTMYDGFGNKTETRCFNNHPRLQCVMLRTTSDGKRQVFVYGQNGDVKDLPEDMLDKTTTASGDELADAAGLFEVRQKRTQPAIALSKPQNSQSLQPMPSYKFPIQNQSPARYESSQQEKRVTDTTSGSESERNTSQAGERRETVTQNHSLNERNED